MRLSLSQRRLRMAVYARVLALLPCEPEAVVRAIDHALQGRTGGLKDRLVEARLVAERCSCPEGLELLRSVLCEPPSALGALDLHDYGVARHALHVRNTAPPPSVCRI